MMSIDDGVYGELVRTRTPVFKHYSCDKAHLMNVEIVNLATSGRRVCFLTDFIFLFRNFTTLCQLLRLTTVR
jgi:hypothetical protein